MVFEVVSATKKIRPLSGQTLVAGEKNSQYVRFEMDRFWDGIDISAKNFSITYSLAGKYYGTSEAVSAEVSTDKLRFGWIVPEEACCIAGTLMFVLVIKSDGYVLKTQIAETPVIKSLDEDSVVPEPTREAWYKEFQARVQEDLNDSQAALNNAHDALTRANTANDAASSALIAASEANLAAQNAIEVAKIRYGSPLVANAGPEMVDTNRVYVFTGSESAYTYGHWYYYDNGVWNDGGVYNGNSVNTDKTLSVENMPADAKKTGDEINELKSGFNKLTTATAEDVGKALKAKTVTDGKVTEWEFGEAGDTAIIASAYKATSTYAVGDYCVHDNALYKCNTAIETAEAWNAEHWTAVTVGEELTQNNERLDMLVTMQRIEPEPVPENVQCLNPANTTVQTLSSSKRVKIIKMDVSRDGTYFGNPYAVVEKLSSVALYNEYDEQITLTKHDGTIQTSINTLYVGSSQNAWFTISDNGYTLKTYVRNGINSNTFTLSSKASYIGANTYYDVSNSYDYTKTGITYNEKYEEYIPYGDSPDVPVEYEYGYNLDLAKLVQEYLVDHGTGVSNRIYDVTYPEKNNSEFVNAVKYYHERADRQRNNVIRIGSFNKFVSRGKSNWSTIKQELADYSLDICGFQECSAIVSDGAVTEQIGSYLQGWQFGGYAVQDTVVDKAIVSHWTVTHTDLITLLTYDNNAGTSNCIHALMSIPTDAWYSDAIDAEATLSVYCYHGKSSGATIGGTSYSSLQVRQMEINALLAILANDTSDFIVIVGDTNCFESGFDIATGTHQEWELFRNAGYTPVLDGHDSTVTAELEDKYFCKSSDDKVYCLASYDQIFIGANITAECFGVVDSNLYPVEALGGVPVSDHCMVYADLRFDFEAVQQAKLRNIAVTEKWWK
jgi:hypothetical protein